MNPSPVRLTTRPRCAPIAGSIRSLRSATQPGERTLLVGAGEPAVSDDIGDQDSRDAVRHGAPLSLHGPNGAKDEFLLAATAQNLRKLAKFIPLPTPIFAT